MNFPYFIAQRLIKQGGQSDRSKPAVRVAVLGMSIGIIVMIITIFVAIGFKKEVKNKIVGFRGDIEITNFENNNTYEMRPITVSDSLIGRVKSLHGVVRADCFATKPGMIKTDSSFQSVVFKGVDSTYNWSFFEHNLKEGRLPKTGTNEILLSNNVVRKLQLALDTTVFCYFLQSNSIRVRKMQVVGVYSTDLEDYDNLFVIGDLGVVQKLNGWDENQVSGIEIGVDNYDNLNTIADEVYFATANRLNKDGEALYTQTIQDLNSQMFAWLELLDMNVLIIILLMLAVAGFNIISGLIIIILDSVTLVGVLKTLGATNWTVRKVFLWQAVYLVLKGMIWGNIVGLLLCVIQYYTHVIPLDPSAYYVSYVPIYFDWLWWVVLNLGTLMVSFLILLGPSHIITNISPAKVMHYE